MESKLSKTRIAAIDFGLARIGIALSDERKIIASSLGMIQAERTTPLSAKKVAEKLASYSLEVIIVGMPLHMNGKKGFLADEVTLFIAHLKELVKVDVLPWDERLSTVQAERSLLEGNMSRKKRAKVVDGVAATILLQSFLDLKHIEAERALLN